ncbi:Phytochrome-like protein cph2 [Acaryochloris thomasi RCC1774]|uniref:Phytochrome-like protein cph2 n=1 Tax=Acaryochloris thomasi RCC1774 TaxID=1764569 RepID=A0A2W1JF73_9CYAN|nr:diguanylate cyclase [Acaryochloris thomasi]PZD72350.1 Phytochrome-like protein cph2 [Acaryochloris thomasi RCC1774]
MFDKNVALLSEPASGDAEKHVQILMVEDDYQDVQLLKALLSQQEYCLDAMTHAQSISEALDCLRSSGDSIELVILDLSLPDAQGLDAYHKICSSCSEVPIIIHSGNIDESIAIEAVQRGAQDYLVKGKFDGHLLGRTIRYALERHQQYLELQSEKLKLQAITAALQHSNQQLEVTNQALEQLATIDELTQIYNRRRFDEVLWAEWRRLAREDSPLSLIMCDVDHFKAYNDTYGHPAGDACLQQVAAAIANIVQRPADLVARYGGEEFAFILPNTDLKGATHIAKDIQAAVQRLNLPHLASSTGDQVTLSLGVASMIPHQDVSPVQLVEAADRALYTAKRLGRNQTQVSLPDLESAITEVRQASHKAKEFCQTLKHARSSLARSLEPAKQQRVPQLRW